MLEDNIRNANLEVLDHLEAILKTKEDNNDLPFTSPSHLVNLIQEARDTDLMHNDKLGRWVGFIQGVMVMQGWLTVEDERNRTRPIFQRAYNN